MVEKTEPKEAKKASFPTGLVAGLVSAILILTGLSALYIYKIGKSNGRSVAEKNMNELPEEKDQSV